MQWIVRADGEVPIYVTPPAWSQGQEKSLVHSLVEADREAVELIWQSRKSASRLGELILERGAQHVAEQLSLRRAEDQARFDEVLAYLDQELPERRALWPRLDRTSLPALAWEIVQGRIARCRRLKELEAPPILLEDESRQLSQCVLVLLEPQRACFGGGYDSLAGLIEDAVAYAAVRPLHEIGLREQVEYLSPRAQSILSRKAARRALAGVEKYWIVLPEDAAALHARLSAVRPEDHAEENQLRRLMAGLAAADGVYLMSTTKWHDWVLASGSSLGTSDLAGVFKVCNQ